MEWSISKSKMFMKCQRKWYYYTVVASPTSKDPFRREAQQLKQLQSVHAWRGSVVDRVIQKSIVPEIRRHNLPSEDAVLNYASQLMDKQVDFGKQRKHLCAEVSKSNCEEYCAFFDLEYGNDLAETKTTAAKEEVALALKNLLKSSFLKQIAEDNLYAIAQRELGFQLDHGITISCTPDMVVFFRDKPPIIVDWKVHVYGTTEAWLQLGIYAVALHKAKPHKDFPAEALRIASPTEIRLVEFQLLRNFQREYSISGEDIADIEDYAFDSSTHMKRLTNGEKYPYVEPHIFQTAKSPQDCEKCQFRKLCWKELPARNSCFQANLGGFIV